VSDGAWIHDAVTRHFGSLHIEASCTVCSAVDPEKARMSQPKEQRRTIPDEVLFKLCPDGRAIYRSYLRWLAEPE